MSDAEAEGEQPSEGADSAESGASDGDEQPAIDAGEQADVGDLADIAEEVEAEAGASTDDEDADDTEESEATEPAPPSSGADWGDLYVGTVTTGLNAVIEEYGDEDAEPVDESLARDLHLDEYVNDWMAEQGKAEMDPAQGMVLATGALCLTVLVSKTDLPSKALNRAQSDD